MNFKLHSYGFANYEVCAKISVLSLACSGTEVVFSKVFGHDIKVRKWFFYTVQNYIRINNFILSPFTHLIHLVQFYEFE